MIKELKSYFLKRRIHKRFPTLKTNGHIYIEFEEKLKIGEYCFINEYAYWSAKGEIEIGNNVIFGPKTTIWTYNHDYRGTHLPYGGPDILKKVTIEDNVWVGMNTIILPGVHIGEGSIIGAGSVVTKPIPKFSIVGGNPARIITERDKENYYNLIKAEKYYLKDKNRSHL